jgi:hypothetical protein
MTLTLLRLLYRGAKKLLQMFARRRNKITLTPVVQIVSE